MHIIGLEVQYDVEYRSGGVDSSVHWSSEIHSRKLSSFVVSSVFYMHVKGGIVVQYYMHSRSRDTRYGFCENDAWPRETVRATAYWRWTLNQVRQLTYCTNWSATHCVCFTMSFNPPVPSCDPFWESEMPVMMVLSDSCRSGQRIGEVGKFWLEWEDGGIFAMSLTQYFRSLRQSLGSTPGLRWVLYYVSTLKSSIFTMENKHRSSLKFSMRKIEASLSWDYTQVSGRWRKSEWGRNWLK